MGITAMGGTLIRVAQNQWQWADGTPEPAASDLTLSNHYNYRVRNYADESYVEVLLSDCHACRDDLGWVLDGVEAGDFEQSTSGDHTGPVEVTADGTRRRSNLSSSRRAIPRVALVPVEDWDRVSRENPIGATWDIGEEERIFAKARSLGWEK